MKKIFKISMIAFALGVSFLPTSVEAQKVPINENIKINMKKSMRFQYFYFDGLNIEYVYNQVHCDTELGLSYTGFVLNETYVISRVNVPVGKVVHSNLVDLGYCF